MTQWAQELVDTVATEVRNLRIDAGMSARALADRTKELGHEVPRATISDLENGRRGTRLMLPDLVVLAAALGTSPGFLMYPYDQEQAEVLPGEVGTSASARGWLSEGIPFIKESDALRELEEARAEFEAATVALTVRLDAIERALS